MRERNDKAVGHMRIGQVFRAVGCTDMDALTADRLDRLLRCLPSDETMVEIRRALSQVM